MQIKLKEKYRVYNGDSDQARRAQTQYGNGRSGGGNGKRSLPQNVTEDFKKASATLSKSVLTAPKTMVVNALTGHKVMVAL